MGGLNLGGVACESFQWVGVYTPEYHFCLGTASLEGRMTGATDGSTPVGSALLFVQLL